MQPPEEPNPLAATFATLLSSMMSSDSKEASNSDAKSEAKLDSELDSKLDSELDSKFDAKPAMKSDSKRETKLTPAWGEEDESLEALTSLSYESALKTHSRYRPNPDPASMPPMAAKATPQPVAASSNGATYAPASTPAQVSSLLPKKPLKSTSITVRMSEAECERLRQRAAEAGMTVSAYLRSCSIEAETLRAQVKEVMAELRAAAVTAVSTHVAAPEPPRRSFFDRLLARPHSLEHALRA